MSLKVLVLVSQWDTDKSSRYVQCHTAALVDGHVNQKKENWPLLAPFEYKIIKIPWA